MDFVRDWYLFLSQLSESLGEPVRQLAGRVQFPVANAFLFGLLGATAPCQLTTNLSAIAYVSRGLRDGRPWLEAATYTLGKAIVYTVLGVLAIGLGLQIQGLAIPVVAVARRALGPLMILIGLMFLGWL